MVENNKQQQRTSRLFVDEKLIIDINREDLFEYENCFKSLDKDKSGCIDAAELLSAFHSMGYRDMTENDAKSIIKEVDLNNNQKVEYSEFIMMMKKFKGMGMTDKFTKIVNKEGQTQFKVEGAGSYSTFSEEERTAYVKVINSVLANDPDCQSLLPINPNSMDLFPSLKNGIILCKLVNVAQPGTIDERVINKEKNMNVFLCTQNLKLALASCKSVGVKVIGIDTFTFLKENYVLILGVIWQLIKVILLANVDIKHHPELIKLLNPGEELADFLKNSPESILKRWFNYHLKKAEHPNTLNNFNKDLMDCEKYTILLNQLNPNKCDKSALDESDILKRGEKVLENAKKLGANSYITPQDIKNGHEKLNLMFVAEIFNNFHGLEELSKEEQEAYDSAKLLDDDVEGTREERAFRMWMNSLGLDDDLYVNNLYEDCRSGVLLLKVIDKVKPGSVNWKKVENPPKNNFAKQINCNEAIDSCKLLGVNTTTTRGKDIFDANRKLILGIVWQLMKASTLQVLGNKTEKDIIAWVNTMVKLDPPIKAFDDKRLKTSIILLDIMHVIEPRAIDWEIVKKEDSPEALENNAKYAISVARKLGAAIFCVWEDISEVKAKMLLTFCASLYHIHTIEEKLNKEKKIVGGNDINVGLDA